MRRDTAELIAAYADGVAELSTDERRRVDAYLASDPTARAELDDTRAAIARARELVEHDDEPDWTRLEHQIRDAVDVEDRRAPRRAWWRRWRLRFALPALAIGAAATLAIVLSRGPDVPEAPVAAAPPAPARPPEHAPADVSPDTLALYLDGSELDVPLDDLDDSALDAIDRDVLGLDDVSLETLRAEGDVMLVPDDARWIDTIDELDAGALERAQDWLDRQTASLRKGGKS